MPTEETGGSCPAAKAALVAAGLGPCLVSLAIPAHSNKAHAEKFVDKREFSGVLARCYLLEIILEKVDRNVVLTQFPLQQPMDEPKASLILRWDAISDKQSILEMLYRFVKLEFLRVGKG